MEDILTNLLVLVSAACCLVIGIDYSNTFIIVLSILNIVSVLLLIVLTFKVRK